MPGPAQPFPSGHSANPGGRPKKTPEMREAEDLARAKSPDAMRRLIEIATQSGDEKAAIMAADKILDRAFGKPVQAITGGDGEPLMQQALDVTRLNDEQLRALLAIGSAVGLGIAAGAAGTIAPERALDAGNDGGGAGGTGET